MEVVAEHELSVLLSSHLVSDLERVCDYLIVLVASRVRVAGEVDELLATHHRLTGPRRDPATLPAEPAGHRGQPHRPAVHVLVAQHATRSLDPAWTVDQLDLEDLVLAYMGQAATASSQPAATIAGGAAMIWLTWRQFRTQAIAAGGVSPRRHRPRRHRAALADL